jgi:hypothetical protein
MAEASSRKELEDIVMSLQQELSKAQTGSFILDF